jgi:hypothetical protein
MHISAEVEGDESKGGEREGDVRRYIKLIMNIHNDPIELIHLNRRSRIQPCTHLHELISPSGT